MSGESFRFIPFRESDNRYIPLVVVLAIVLAGLLFVFGIAYQAERVDGDSMRETLQSGDRILLTRGYPTPRRGDVVSADVVIHGDQDTIIKRVVAVEGDEIEISGDQITVDGVLLEWPGVIIGSSDGSHLGPLVVPRGYVYLMGDNRPVSLDSRFIGPVPVTDIRGRAVAIFSPVTRIGVID